MTIGLFFDEMILLFEGGRTFDDAQVLEFRESSFGLYIKGFISPFEFGCERGVVEVAAAGE